MISLAITSHNRDDLTIKAIRGAYNHTMISEIVIVDDCSEKRYFDNLIQGVACMDSLGKIRTSRNSENLGMMLNKRKAISLCTNEWVIIFDSDNEIDSTYLEAIPENLDPDVIYCPSFAKPTFDYRKFSGWLVGITEAKRMVKDRMGNACFNTCNYIVHRDTYLKVFKEDEKVKGTDTIAMNYEWLKSGRKFFIVPGMEYYHRVHDGSGFMKDADYNMRMAEIYKQKILAL